MNLDNFIYGDRVSNVQKTDWRLPENRLEAFRRIAVTRMYEGDLDHWHSGHVIASEMNLTQEQKAIYALIFGQSYRNHWAMIVLQQFPDILCVDIKHIREWHDVNWKRAFYAKDTKWGLRKFPDYIESIKKAVGNNSAYDFIEKYSTVGNTSDNYYSINNKMRELYGIGRMTAWLTQQTIYEFFDFDINHWDMQLYDDTWSQYDSLCYLFNREDIANKVNGVKRKVSSDEIELMEENFIHLMEYCNDNSDIVLDVYNIESCLCEYRKTSGAGGRKPKEFTFWTGTESAMEYKSLKDSWPEVNWNPYCVALCTKGGHVRKFYFSTEYFYVMSRYGLNLNTHYYFDDEPDAFELLNLPKYQGASVKVLLDDFTNIKEYDTYYEKYNPMKYLRFVK